MYAITDSEGCITAKLEKTSQALLAAKAGATYISPFLGRLDDISHDGVELIRDIAQIYDNYDMKTQILAASIRHPKHFVDVALAGADVATIPANVFWKLFERFGQVQVWSV